MKKEIFLLTIVLVLTFVSVLRAGSILYVDVNSPNDPGTGTFDDPFRKIQTAIDAANADDVVEIWPGIYTGQDNYDLDPNGKSITIRSTDPNDPEMIANTIIDPNGAGRGFYFHSGEDANCMVSGLTIRNGYSITGYNGGNIYCYGSCPTIRNCIIKDGYATGSGGGVYSLYSNLKIANCTLTGNLAEYYGGGISSTFCDPVVTECTIISNTAFLEGGGIDCGQSSPDIMNCIIANNESLYGGGINCYFPGIARVVNCTLAVNSAGNAGGAVYSWRGSSAIIENSILWANSAPDGTQIGLDEEGTASVTYCDVQDGQTGIYDPCGLLVWGQGNIDADPCFVSFDPNGDPNLWDFHLQSVYGRWNTTFYRIDFNRDGIINLAEFAWLAGSWLVSGNLQEDLDNSGIIDWIDLGLLSQYYLANRFKDGWLTDATTSPCVDAGDPNSDWTDEPWPNGKRVNMGAYGGTTQASMNGNIADFDVSGSVNFADFAELSSKWLTQQKCIEDLSGNGIIDFIDLDMFIKNWLWQRE